MADTPNRKYPEIPTWTTPDVPYHVNRAIRAIDQDVQKISTTVDGLVYGGAGSGGAGSGGVPVVGSNEPFPVVDRPTLVARWNTTPYDGAAYGWMGDPHRSVSYRMNTARLATAWNYYPAPDMQVTGDGLGYGASINYDDGVVIGASIPEMPWSIAGQGMRLEILEYIVDGYFDFGMKVRELGELLGWDTPITLHYSIRAGQAVQLETPLVYSSEGGMAEVAKSRGDVNVAAGEVIHDWITFTMPSNTGTSAEVTVWPYVNAVGDTWEITDVYAYAGAHDPNQEYLDGDMVGRGFPGASPELFIVSPEQPFPSAFGNPDTVELPVGSALVNPSGGTGGALTDAAYVEWTNGTTTSRYDLYSSHIDPTTANGIIVMLDGDEPTGDRHWWYQQSAQSHPAAIIDWARDHGLMVLIPNSPDNTGSRTWWEDTASGTWAMDLLDHITGEYNVDLNRVFFYGLSGGADVITEQIMYSHSDSFTGGGAVIQGGGAMETSLTSPSPAPSAAVLANFQMSWVLGSLDTGDGVGGEDGGYDALTWGQQGYDWWTTYGANTSLNIIQGKHHFNTGPDAFEVLRSIVLD